MRRFGRVGAPGIHDICPAGDDRTRISSSQRLPGTEQIWNDARMIAGPHPASSTETGVDLVGDQHELEIVA